MSKRISWLEPFIGEVMTLSNGPYYTTTSQAVDNLGTHVLPDDRSNIYPELGHSTPSEAQMYALADDALQVHQHNRASQFAGLIRAATAAAGQADQTAEHSNQNQATTHGRRTTRRGHGPKQTPKSGDGEGGDLDSPIAAHRGQGDHSHHTGKRKRTSDDTGRNGDEAGVPQSGQPPFSDTPAPISQSASSLFRRPSSTSKKYTRPPMSKLFTSLELSPESFLQLQSAAKNYMLNDTYPDRRETVGQRGRGDSELVKLRLWNCVKEFLETEGNGERFFGPHISGDEGRTRTMFWPSHKNNIITAVTPLLRRMVTNERQRQYAVETRKPGHVNEGKTSATQKLIDEARLPQQMGRDPPHLALSQLFDDINGTPFGEYGECRNHEGSVMPIFVNVSERSYLSVEDFNALLAIIDYHVRALHKGDSPGDSICDPDCESAVISRMLESGHLDHFPWGRGRRKSIDEKHN